MKKSLVWLFLAVEELRTEGLLSLSAGVKAQNYTLFQSVGIQISLFPVAEYVSLYSLRSSEALFTGLRSQRGKIGQKTQCSLDRVFPCRMKTGEERGKVAKQEQGKKRDDGFRETAWKDSHVGMRNLNGNEKNPKRCVLIIKSKTKQNCQNSLNCRMTGALRSLKPLTDFYEAPV